MLHSEPPSELFWRDLRDIGIPAAARGKPRRGELGRTDGRRQPDPAGMPAYDVSEPRQLTDDLVAPVAAGECVYLVDHDEPQVGEDPRDVRRPVYEHGLERLRSDLKDPAGIGQQFLLVRARDVPVPVRDRDPGHVEKLVEPAELVVDQALQGSDVEDCHALRRVFVHHRDDRKKGCLGLSAGRRRGQQQVVVIPEDRLSRGDLDRTERIPRVRVYVFFYKRRELVEH